MHFVYLYFSGFATKSIAKCDFEDFEHLNLQIWEKPGREKNSISVAGSRSIAAVGQILFINITDIGLTSFWPKV